MKNLQVIDPTINTLTVRWEPAVGNVRTYKVFYMVQPGGEQLVVKTPHEELCQIQSESRPNISADEHFKLC